MHHPSHVGTWIEPVIKCLLLRSNYKIPEQHCNPILPQKIQHLFLETPSLQTDTTKKGYSARPTCHPSTFSNSATCLFYATSLFVPPQTPKSEAISVFSQSIGSVFSVLKSSLDFASNTFLPSLYPPANRFLHFPATFWLPDPFLQSYS